MPYIAAPVVADDEKMQELWHTYKGGSVAISADGTRIAVISGDTISLYDQYGLNPLWSFQTVPVDATGNAYTLDKGAYDLDQVAISRDGKYVAVAGTNTGTDTSSNSLVGARYIFLIDETGKWIWEGGATGAKVDNVVNNIAISDDGSYVSIGSWTACFLYDHNGMYWRRVEPSFGNGPAVVSGDGKYVATVSGSGIVLYKSERVEPQQIAYPVYEKGLGGRVSHIAISTDGKMTLCASVDHNIYMHSISGNRMWSATFGGDFKCLDMTPSGNYSVICTSTNNLIVYDESGQKVWSKTLDNWANSVAISDDGKYVAAATSDGLVIVFDSTGKELWRKLSGSAEVNKVSISADGSYVAAASDSDVVLYHNGPSASKYSVTPTAVPGFDTPTPTAPAAVNNSTVGPVTTGGGGDSSMMLIVGGIVVVIIGAGIGLFLMSRKGKDGLPSIEINIGNATEDEDVNGSVYVVAGGPGASLNGVIRLSGKIVRTIDGPGEIPVAFGQLPAGSYEFHVECTARDIQGKEVKRTVVKPFSITEAVPEVTADAPPLVVAEGEAVRAKVTLTNPSKHPAVFDTFVLNPAESKDYWFDIDTSTTGKGEKKVSISFKNKAGRNYTTEAVIKYTVQPATPDIQATVAPISVPQDESGLARVTLTNVSDFPAIFDNFTLKKGDSYTLDFLVEGKAPGEAVATMPVSFRNLVGRRFDMQIPVKYKVFAVEPVVEVRAESVELAGGQGFVLASIGNQSEYEALFEGFTLKIGESRPVRLPVNDISPGKHQELVKVTYKNRNGRVFEQSVSLSYEISPEMLKAAAAASAAEGSGDAITMNVGPARTAFISYAHQERPVADAIVAALESAGVSCWIAPRDVTPGTPFEKAIMNAINRAQIFVLVYSASSNKSPHVQNEVREAWKRGIPIIPFRIQDVPMSDVMNYYISSMHWIDAVTPPLDSHIGGLSGTVKHLLKNPGGIK